MTGSWDAGSEARRETGAPGGCQTCFSAVDWLQVLAPIDSAGHGLAVLFAATRKAANAELRLDWDWLPTVERVWSPNRGPLVMFRYQIRPGRRCKRLLALLASKTIWPAHHLSLVLRVLAEETRSRPFLLLSHLLLVFICPFASCRFGSLFSCHPQNYTLVRCQPPVPPFTPEG